MSDRIDVACVLLREAYTFEGTATRWLTAKEYALGYEDGTDKLVVQKRGSSKVHVIPWSNVLGIELVTQTPAATQAPAAKEPAIARPSPAVGTGGGSRRTRPTQ